MADTMKKNYKISGSGVLDINDDTIIVCVEDKGEFNLADVLSDLNGRSVKFNFSYDEEYASIEKEDDDILDIDEETGEIID